MLFRTWIDKLPDPEERKNLILEDNIISQAEYDEIKAEILNNE